MTRNNPMILVGLAAVFLFLACREATPEPQRVEVAVTANGYEPSEIPARSGQPLTLVFTRTSEEGCGQEVVLAEAGIRRELPLNEPVEVTYTPNEAGRVRFTCGMRMYEGAIVVR